MNILQHHYHNGGLQRSECEDQGNLYLRVHTFFNRVTGDLESPPSAHWYNLDPAAGPLSECGTEERMMLERLFVAELIRLNAASGPLGWDDPRPPLE